ncbi:MAG TPA: DNA polymerase IV [Pseudogracilibacillus sp.]|nr:DNA polymerase IV [Pseudogracilibacillus sp.]
MKKKARVIFHIDMNCFYASVEVAHNPKLKGKPVAIAGNPEERRGIVVTSSYEARAKGVKTTMAVWEARKLCPNLIILRPNFEKYRDKSKEIFSLLYEMTPLVEPVSIDEGYIDVTDHTMHPIQLAQLMQNRILNELKIPCSIGIGPNKFLAKTASDMKKPLGITVLRIRDLPRVLWPLPIDKMYGLGEKTAEKLRKVDINTIGDLAKADTYILNHLLGINGERLQNRANGVDPRMVDPNSVNDIKSVGNSTTLAEDTIDRQEIEKILRHLTHRVEERLLRRDLKSQNVQLMIRYKDRKTVTRSKKIHRYTNDKADIYEHIINLFDEHWNEEPIRLLGVTMQDVIDSNAIKEQLSLFSYKEEEKKYKVERTKKKLTKKFGDDVFKSLKQEEEKKDDKMLRTSFQKDFLDDFKQ